MGQLGCRALCLGLLDYKTEKYVVVKNKKVGLLYRLLQLAILLYLLGWVFLEKKGYQVVDAAVQSSVITKVKGVAFTNTSELREKIWDEADYVMPSQGGNAFFVITSLIVTPRQRQTTCAEWRKRRQAGLRDSPKVTESVNVQGLSGDSCPAHRAPTSPTPCAPRTATAPEEKLFLEGTVSRGTCGGLGHRAPLGIPEAPPGTSASLPGVRTGRCVRAGSKGRGTCEISAWCPVEGRRRPEKLLLEKAADFTVYIKNSIRFPQFNFSKALASQEGNSLGPFPSLRCPAVARRSNVRDTKDKSFLKSCHFGPHNHYCPIFRLGSLVHAAGHDFREMALEGGVIGIRIEWDCDLDQAPSACRPRYSFSRLDGARAAASGYNFRYAKYYQDADGVEFRTLTKVYGIRFDVLVSGKAGKFSIVPTLVNVGSGVALMRAVVFFCDLVLIYLIKKSHFYREKKYEDVGPTSRRLLAEERASASGRGLPETAAGPPS
ncbi:P2X purinoceptor 5 isoform X2 [Monodelphis domestica]|uniref:P2X purinoceptor 5 isoform X2 n=1 Tax=Monodelphis domestica TaxID=13616 RepID=UPI0024E1B79D|nr:P2X purinoceptor 5 isoform X2 [Monodelphis domestica]